jgi:hypothetical protein
VRVCQIGTRENDRPVWLLPTAPPSKFLPLLKILGKHKILERIERALRLFGGTKVIAFQKPY